MKRRTLNPQSLLVLATLGVFVTAVAPLKWSGWTNGLRGPFKTLIAPVSGPINTLATWLRPGESRRAAVDATTDQLTQQVEFFRSETLRLEQQVEQMKQLIEALQSGAAYGPPLRLKRVEATRVGADLGAGTIDVSRGTMDGVAVGSVAVPTSAPQHLIGVVSSVGPTVATVQVITNARVSPNLLTALILPAGSVAPDALARAPRCQFRPVGDGSLVGEISAEAAAVVQRGDAAFLDDASWPSGAQRLIIGRVARTEDSDNPLFKRLVVVPDLDLLRVRSVVLRTPTDEASPAGGGAR
ncbi:MAG: hypothetical protein JNK58_11115 [Phycisphaerae bacterium]|nr:hypothetical protein [Phycisphaerae bacterium]